jgi:hypothetical protein
MADFLYGVFICTTSVFLDLYFLGRMFKTPAENINSYLAIGLFGQAHTQNIAQYLTSSLGWYDKVVEGVPFSLRCLTFSGDIDLSQDLEEYARMRQRKQAIQPYVDRLAIEQFQRESLRQLYELDSSSIQVDGTDDDINLVQILRQARRWFERITDDTRVIDRAIELLEHVIVTVCGGFYSPRLLTTLAVACLSVAMKLFDKDVSHLLAECRRLSLPGMRQCSAQKIAQLEAHIVERSDTL